MNIKEILKSERMAINVKNRDEFLTLASYLDKNGYLTSNKTRYLDIESKSFDFAICFFPSIGKFATKEYYLSKGVQVIEFLDISFEEKSSPNKISLSEILNNTRAVIHISTEKQELALATILNSLGKKWKNNEKYGISLRWNQYQDQLCYLPSRGEYCNLKFFMENKYEIYEFDMVDFEQYVKGQPEKISKEVALKILSTLINELHDDYGSQIDIKTAPKENALAWFDAIDGTINITDRLSAWSVQLLYVLPLHEKVHKLAFGLFDDYKDGYHNEDFRLIFESLSGMRTYHDAKLGWQFVSNIGEKYIKWLSLKKDKIDGIMDVIAKTDLSDEEQQQQGDGSGEKGDGEKGESKQPNGDGKSGEKGDGKSEEDKINEVLRKQNQADAKNEKGDGEKGNGDKEKPAEHQPNGGEYNGLEKDIKVGTGKKRFTL